MRKEEERKIGYNKTGKRLAHIIHYGKNLTSQETSFIESIAKQYRASSFVSEKQKEAIAKIYEKKGVFKRPKKKTKRLLARIDSEKRAADLRAALRIQARKKTR